LNTATLIPGASPSGRAAITVACRLPPPAWLVLRHLRLLQHARARETWCITSCFVFCAAKNQSAIPSAGGCKSTLGKPARAIFLLTCLLIILPIIPGLPDNIENPPSPGIHHADDRRTRLVRHRLHLRPAGHHAPALRPSPAENNFQARRVHTQFQLFRRMLITFVVIIDIGALLWTFNDPRIWHYGSGLLASAGIASLILATPPAQIHRIQLSSQACRSPSQNPSASTTWSSSRENGGPRRRDQLGLRHHQGMGSPPPSSFP